MSAGERKQGHGEKTATVRAEPRVCETPSYSPAEQNSDKIQPALRVYQRKHGEVTLQLRLRIFSFLASKQ